MFLIRLIQSIKSTLPIVSQIIRNDHSKLNFNLALAATNSQAIKSNRWSLESLIDGLLWSAPKQRRPIEKRMRRRFGYWDRFNPATKMLKKKYDLMICDECGSWHEMANICQVCYIKVKKETNLIQEAIMKKLGLQPVEKEVKLKYEKEEVNNTGDEYFVEIPAERPQWFASNLISNTVAHTPQTKQPSENNSLEAKIVDK